MTTESYTKHKYTDEPFTEMVAYTLDHQKLVLEIRVAPDPEQPPRVTVTDELTKCRYEPRCEETTTYTDTIKVYRYERICVEESSPYTYWLRLILVDSTALVSRPEQFPDPDYITERRQHWTILPQLEQVCEVPMSTLPIRKQ